MWRVLVVEDDPKMRDFFAQSVSRCPDLALVASAATVVEAKNWLNLHMNSVDVLLVDLGLPDGSGLDVIRHAAGTSPDCESLVISMFGDEDNVLASIEAGALGYIHKDSAPADIAQTILEMKDGASPISPMIARKVLTKYASSRSPLTGGGSMAMPRNNNVADQPGVVLSAREQEVLMDISLGYSYAEIARQKLVSVHTVQSHVKNLYAKLSVHSKLAAINEARRLGLLSHPG
jgi:DNA-binding NarL/FixJ family response regulator